MKTSKFQQEQITRQVDWRSKAGFSSHFGYQNKHQYAHIVPKHEWKKTIWEPIRGSVVKYINEASIQHHTGTHNLMSSWILCTNLYMPVRFDESFRDLMVGFLSEKLGLPLVTIDRVEIEFAFEGVLNPESLLGETGGSRGSGQTSPDVAFFATYDKGQILVLTECKYTEHSFYRCSARRTTSSTERIANPDPTRCISRAIDYDYSDICHQSVWGRKY